MVAADAAGALIRLDAPHAAPRGPAVIASAGRPVDVALQGDRAWVADARRGHRAAVALATGRRRPAGRASAARRWRSPPTRGGVYVLCRGDRTLVELDRRRRRPRAPAPGHAPTALALDPRHVWIAAGDHEVIRVDR